MNDKYDEAIAYLTEHPEEIYKAWSYPGHRDDSLPEPSGALFLHTGPWCGCLTQIRGGAMAPSPELTAEIRADERIPENPLAITVEALPVFAEWQRRLDAWHAAQDGGEG